MFSEGAKTNKKGGLRRIPAIKRRFLRRNSCMPQIVHVYNPDVPIPHDVQNVVIPDSVTSIEKSTFSGCSSLRSITIPDSVTSIGDFAFEGCSSLRSITIPGNVTRIRTGTFKGCSSLESITIPNGVTNIGFWAFSECSSLQSIILPDGVINIGDGAFLRCSSLQTITIPDSVTSIGGSAFHECSSLRSITIPGNVDGIRDRTFQECSSLQSITMPNSVTYIGDMAFRECSSLQSIIIPDSVTNIGRSAFWKCSSLQSIEMPDSMTNIGSSALYGCSSLRAITIPDGVTNIRENTFCGCSSLRSITIPGSVTSIEDAAFKGCTSLKSITMPDDIKIRVSAFEDCAELTSLIFKGVNIIPFINIDGYGVNTFRVIRELVNHGISLNEYIVKRGIERAHRGRLEEWTNEYARFGDMSLSPAAKTANEADVESLRRYFMSQTSTGCHVPKILNELVITTRACRIPPERLVSTFDIDYTKDLIAHRTPLVPAEACRCYYDRSICDALNKKNKAFVMANAIRRYNASHQNLCHKHMMDFIVSHMSTKTEDLVYAVDHAEEIPMRENTTLAEIRQYRAYMQNFSEIGKIEAEYKKYIPEFKLSNYSCSIEQTGITYNGMTARILDLSNMEDISLAARLGELTNCCQHLESAGETAMMHGFMNPDAGFWVIEDKDGTVKAQAEIWKSNYNTLVFDNIEFANTDRGNTEERIEQLRNVIAAWAVKAGYRNIIMGCGYNELGTKSMEQAPLPKLILTPEEVFAFQKDNDACVEFKNIAEAEAYMQTPQYKPEDFIYTDADKQCVYIKKDGKVSDYLMQGYDHSLTGDGIPNMEGASEREIGSDTRR